MIKVKVANKDKKMKKFMEEFIEHEYNRNKKFIEAVNRARVFVEISFGVKTPDNIWFDIMEAHVNQELEAKK